MSSGLSPQPQKLSVRPTPRVVVDDAVLSFARNSSTTGGGVKVHLTSALKSALHSSTANASAHHHQHQHQQMSVGTLSSGGGEGGIIPPQLHHQLQAGSASSYLHNGVAAFRSDTGSVGFYRTSIHQKNPQSVFMTSASNTIVADSAGSTFQQHQGSGNNNTFTSGGTASNIPVAPASPQLRDASPLLERYRGGGGAGESGPSGRKPRWNSSNRRQTPPPQASLQISGNEAVVAMQQQGSSAVRSHSAPRAAGPSSRGLSSSPPNRYQAPSSSSILGNHYQRANAQQHASGAANGMNSMQSVAAVNFSSATLSNHPAVHYPAASQHPQRQRVVNAGSVVATGASRGNHHTMDLSGASSSTNPMMFVHDCQDQHCVHSRGEIMEVIVAKSQVRAMESQLAQVELRLEQLQAKALYEQDRADTLQQLVSSLQSEKRETNQALDEVHASLSAYQSLMADLDQMKELRRRAESERDDALRREAAKSEMCARLEQTVAELTENVRREHQVRLPSVQQPQLAAPSPNHRAESYANVQRQQSTTTLMTLSSSESFQERGFSTSAGSAAAALSTPAPTSTTRGDVQALLEEVKQLRDAKAADDKVRRELLRALADKERQVSNLVHAQIATASGSSTNNSPPQTAAALLTASMSPPPIPDGAS